jgi:hypothetical protein
MIEAMFLCGTIACVDVPKSEGNPTLWGHEDLFEDIVDRIRRDHPWGGCLTTQVKDRPDSRVTACKDGLTFSLHFLTGVRPHGKMFTCWVDMVAPLKLADQISVRYQCPTPAAFRAARDVPLEGYTNSFWARMEALRDKLSNPFQ